VAELTSAALLKAPAVITHNGPAFDHVVATRYGIGDWEKIRWEDTLQLAHALESHLPKGLAAVVTRHGIDVAPWKELEDRGVDIERLWIYNGRDCLYTTLLWHAMSERLR
jgi:hypothetical protein